MMAFFERDYIEIKRENISMSIVGTRREGIEQDEVVRFMRKQNARKKRAPLMWALMLVFMWALAAAPVVLDVLFGYRHRAGSFTIGSTVFLSLMAIYCTVMTFVKGGFIREQPVDVDSAEAQRANAGDALDRKLKKKYELCQAHDMISMDSALAGRPVFIGSFQRPLSDVERMNESALVTKYAKQCAQAQMDALSAALAGVVRQSAAPGSADALLVYLDIDKLDSGMYGMAAGEAVAKAVPAELLEGMRLSSGDSNATLRGSANEYVIGIQGPEPALGEVEARLRADGGLKALLSASGIRRGAGEPLVADGTVQGGALVNPPGHSTSFCGAGLRGVWEKQKQAET